jgi:hypothetical protein
MNKEKNLLEELSDMFAMATDFRSYIEEAKPEQIKLMLNILTNKVIDVSDFILDSVDLEEFE